LGMFRPYRRDVAVAVRNHHQRRVVVLAVALQGLEEAAMNGGSVLRGSDDEACGAGGLGGAANRFRPLGEIGRLMLAGRRVERAGGAVAVLALPSLAPAIVCLAVSNQTSQPAFRAVSLFHLALLFLFGGGQRLVE